MSFLTKHSYKSTVDDDVVEGLTFDPPDSIILDCLVANNSAEKWLDIGSQGGDYSIGLCCDPKHTNFGQVSTYAPEYHSGSPEATHLVELFKDLYWK